MASSYRPPGHDHREFLRKAARFPASRSAEGIDLPPDYGDLEIFRDGFESGDVGSWTSHQP